MKNDNEYADVLVNGNDISDNEGETSVRLRKCPFCGCTETLSMEKTLVDGVFKYGVSCNWCGINQYPRLHLEDAVSAWNMRDGKDYNNNPFHNPFHNPKN